MHKIYFMLHIILVVAAVAGTFWGWQNFRQARETVGKVNAQEDVPVSSERKTTVGNRTSRRDTKSFPDKNILWEKFLFSPQRSEGVDITKSNTSNKSDHNRKKIDMELVGIGSLGSKSAAIIFVKSRNRNKKENNRHVYVKGAQVEDTGYKVDKITLQEVTLVRANGEEERVLRIHRQDSASQGRSKTAAKHATRARKASEEKLEEEKQKKKKESAPKPPPPPPAPGAGSPGDAGGSTPEQREERQKQIEERKERLQKLREVLKKRRQRIKEASEE